MSSGPENPPGLQSTIGPLFVGLLLSIGFQGLLVAQGYVYWKTYRDKDSRVFGYLVYCLCALELFHSIVTAHAGYWYFVHNYNQPTAIDHLVWSIIAELALTVMISFIGRAFWINWLYNLSHKNRWLTLITSLFSLAQLGLGIGEVYEGARKPFFSTIMDGKVAVVTQMLSADLGDVIISVSLCYYLHSSRSGIPRTEVLIDRLIMFAVTRGVLASGTGFIQLITYLIWPKTFIFGIFHLIASKLYTNALLATLNSRSHLAGHLSNSRRHHITSDEVDTGTSFVLSSIPPDGAMHRGFETKSDASGNVPIESLASRRHHQDQELILPTSSKVRYSGTTSVVIERDCPDEPTRVASPALVTT